MFCRNKGQVVICVLLAISLIFPGCGRKPQEELTEQYKFDQDGRLVQKIAPDGGKTDLKYNQDGLPVEIGYPGGYVKYGYDAQGQRLWMKDNRGTTEYYYDAFNRLAGVLWQYNLTKLIAYDYDSQGNLTHEVIINLSELGKEAKYQGIIKKLQGTNPAKVTKWGEKEALFQKLWQDLRAESADLQRRWLDHEVSYSYDFLRRLVAIQTWQGKITYSYDPSKGQVQRRLPNGIITTITFGPDGMLISLRHETKTGDLIAHYKYDYNAAGKISQTQETTPQGTTTTGYVWDTRGYVKELYRPEGGKVRYDYDVMGNRTLKEDASGVTRYTYDKFGRPVQAGNTRYQWNDNGQMTARWHSPKTSFTYDGRGLPTYTQGPEGTDRNEWDGNGNLISQKTDRGTNLYIPQPMLPMGVPLAEVNNKGTITSNLYQGGSLLGKFNANGGTKFYLGDGFNSLRFSSDSQGKITDPDIPQVTNRPVNIFYGGAGAKNPQLTDEVNKFGYDVGIPVNPGPNFLGVTDFLTAIWDHVTGGLGTDSGKNLLRNTNSQEEKINVVFYSHSAINANNIKDSIRWDTFKGTVTIAGIHPHEELLEFLDNKYHIKPEIKAFDPTIKDGPRYLGKFYDPFTVFTNPNINLGKRVLPDLPGGLAILNALIEPLQWRIGAIRKISVFLMALPGIPGPYSFKAHLSDSYFGKQEGGQKDQKLPERGDPSRQDKGFDFRKPLKGPDWPDGGGGGAAAIRDPFKAVQAKLGGIKLAATGKFIGNLGAIKGAVFDPDRQCLVLLGDEEVTAPQIKPEDLAIALMCVYGPRPQDPSFSLDPADPQNPDGPWLKAVYYPREFTAGTEFGNTLFEADWLLKQYSFGIKVDKEGRRSERKSTVPGFKNSAELSFEEDFTQGERHSRARLWIESDDITLKRAVNGIYFDQVKMRVKAKKQVVDRSSPTGLKDVDTDGDFRAVKFAQLFTQLYGEIAQESQEFERVRQLAKAVALAKWMKERGIPVDMSWVAEYAQKRVPYVERAPRLSAYHERSSREPFSQGNRQGVRTSIRKIEITGGVSLRVNPKFNADDGTVKALQKMVKDALQKKDPAPVFTVKHNGKNLKGWVLPITKFAQDLWANFSGGEIDGIVYQFDKQQNVIKSDDKQGNVTKYEYDDHNNLKKIISNQADSTKVVAEKNGQGSLWKIDNPRGHQLNYAFGAQGFLKEVVVDGQKTASFEINAKKKEIKVNLKDVAERFLYGQNDQIKEYEVQPIPGHSPAKAGKLTFDYNQAGQLTKIAGTGIAPVNIAYTQDGTKPTRIGSPEGNTGYVYYPDGRLKEITDPSGSVTRVTYDGQELANLQVNYKGVAAEYRFTKDGLAQSRDLLGGTIEYKYDRGKLVSVKQGQYGEAKYTYDDRGRLKEIILPDGSRTESRYVEEKPKKGKEKAAGLTLSVITHPAPAGGVYR